MTDLPQDRKSSARRRGHAATHAAVREARRGHRRSGLVAGSLLLLVLAGQTFLPTAAASRSSVPAAAHAGDVVPAVRIAPPSLSVPMLRPERASEGQSARLTLEGLAMVSAVQLDAALVARAALDAAHAVLTAPEPVPARLRRHLVVGHRDLLALVQMLPAGEEPLDAGARPPVGGPLPGSVMGDLAVVAQTHETARAVFALARESDDPGGTGIADTDGPLVGELGELDRALRDVELAPTLPGDLLPVRAAELVRQPSLGNGARSANGALPLDQLCAPVHAPSARLDCAASTAFDAMARAYRTETGRQLDLAGSYRTLAEQSALRSSLGSLAAVPGRSMHGLGLAIDLADAGSLGHYSAPVYRWMVANGARYGWYHPRAMQPGGGGPAEPWHWEFAG